MRSLLMLGAAALLLAGCGGESPSDDSSAAGSAASSAGRNSALRFEDAPAPANAPAVPPLLQIQVVLDRLGFPPGVIEGKDNASYTLALRGFQEANGLEPTGKFDAPTLQAMQLWKSVPATRYVTIPQEFARGPFAPDLPRDAAAQAKLPALSYRDLMEALAERFHTTRETLVALNSPTTKVGAGRVIRVPNIADVDPARLGKDERGWNRTLQTLGVAPNQPRAEKVVVDKSDAALRVFDANGKLIAQFPATMGSEHDPLPLGTWKIQGVSRNPDFHYNPALFWDVSDDKPDQLLKPGPNGPVGVVWLDLSKEHYGIHGTSEPQTIGQAESHGCVRLTNWDAARLAQMVKPGTPAVFQE